MGREQSMCSVHAVRVQCTWTGSLENQPKEIKIRFNLHVHFFQQKRYLSLLYGVSVCCFPSAYTMLSSGTMIKVLPLDILGVSQNSVKE